MRSSDEKQAAAMNEPDVRVDHRKLYALGLRALTKIGVPENHARMTVESGGR